MRMLINTRTLNYYIKQANKQIAPPLSWACEIDSIVLAMPSRGFIVIPCVKSPREDDAPLKKGTYNPSQWQKISETLDRLSERLIAISFKRDCIEIYDPKTPSQSNILKFQNQLS